MWSVLTAPIEFVTGLPWQCGAASAAAAAAAGSSRCWSVLPWRTHRGHRGPSLSSLGGCCSTNQLQQDRRSLSPAPCSRCGLSQACLGRGSPVLKQAELCYCLHVAWDKHSLRISRAGTSAFSTSRNRLFVAHPKSQHELWFGSWFSWQKRGEEGGDNVAILLLRAKNEASGERDTVTW